MKLCIALLLCSFTAFSLKANPSSIYFIENKGQITDQFNQHRPDIDLKLEGEGVTIYIGNGSISYQWAHTTGDKTRHAKRNTTSENPMIETYRMDVQLIGANSHAPLQLEDKFSYFERHYTTASGKDGILAHSYKKAVYKNVYPGIDWIIFIRDNKLEYEFAVNEHADVSKIRLQYKGISSLQINGNGSLTAATPFGSITESAPVSYSGSKEVATSFVLNNDMVSFHVAPYTGKLLIDPSLNWGTYYHGGNGLVQAAGMSSFDPAAVYMCGQSSANDIATTGAYQVTFSGICDGFIAKFDSTGNRLWATYYGGSDEEYLNTVKCSNDGYLYAAGYTLSAANIATNNAFQQLYAGGGDGFLIKFDSTGQLAWGTYYGGTDADEILALETDSLGYIYVAGGTESPIVFATTNAHQFNFGGGSFDAFIAKFDSSGNRIWGSYYGGSGSDQAYNMAIQNGHLYIAGATSSANNIVTTGCHQPLLGNVGDAFLSCFDTSGVQLWGTYYGGANSESDASVCVDRSGYIYLAGTTGLYESAASPNNIASNNGYITTPIGNGDVYVAKFNDQGQRIWGSYYGGPGYEWDNYRNMITSDAWNNIYLGGTGSSTTGIATTTAWQQVHGGDVGDAFVIKMDSNGTPLWGSYYGGFLWDAMGNLLHDGIGNLYLLAATSSINNISTPGAFQETNLGTGINSALARIRDCSIPAQPLPITGDTIICPGATLTLSVPPVYGAYFYTWSLPTGWSGSSDSNTIVVTAGLSGGTVSVTANAYYCGASIPQTLNISLHPLPTPLITQNGNTLDAGVYSSYQWYLNGNILTGATSQTYIVAQPGTYTVMVTDSNGCQAMSPPLPLEIRGMKIADDIIIYPNPTNGIATIKGISGMCEITVMNVFGQVAVKESVRLNGRYTLDISGYAYGFYIVEIRSNGSLLRMKVLKQ